MSKLPVEKAKASDEVLFCLAWLLGATFKESTVGTHIRRAFAADKAATAALRELKIEIKGDGFTVPNIHPGIAAIYAGTRWERPFEHLRKLPDAKPHLPFGGRFAGEFTFIPSYYLGEA